MDRWLLGISDSARRRFVAPWLPWVAAALIGLPLVVWAQATTPKPLTLAVTLLLVVLGLWFVKPVGALSATFALALIGDITTVPWWPFTKNFSAVESLAFVSNSLGTSPLELSLLAGCVALFVQYLVTGRSPFRLGPLRWPLLVFVGFILVGLVSGVARGGDTKTALFEVRPFLYLPVAVLLVSSVCRRSRDYGFVIGACLVAIVVHALLSLQHTSRLRPDQRELTETLMEHSAALRMNVLLVLMLMTFMFGAPKLLRWGLVLAAIPVMMMYLQAQRRAAIIGLGTACILLAVALFWQYRRRFWRVVPIATLVIVAYVGAFWGSDSSAGFPAQAVKSVIAPAQISERDRSSDLYRIIEAFDLNYTIRSNPVLGIGFGNAFYRPIPLADITGFQFAQFIPHNSVLWIWVSTGFGGFAAMMYLFGRSMILGAKRLRNAERGADTLIAATGVTFVAMFAVFAYVDIAWDARDMLMLGLALSICSRSALAKPARAAAQRPAMVRVLEDEHV